MKGNKQKLHFELFFLFRSKKKFVQTINQLIDYRLRIENIDYIKVNYLYRFDELGHWMLRVNPEQFKW